jgi:hypothetical protein
MKTFVRRAKPRTEPDVIDAIGWAFATVTRHDARAWFDHYGYRAKYKRARTERKLLTWNCSHIANASIRGRVETMCRAIGLQPPLICTPEELVEE